MEHLIKLLAVVLVFTGQMSLAQTESKHTLWYEQPAEKWVEALPLGNGRLGAMVYGRVGHEIIQLNEESLWSGQPMDDNNPLAGENIDKIRELILAGKIFEGKSLAEKTMNGSPERVRFFETLGNLELELPKTSSAVTNYRRSLNLASGIATTSYSMRGINFTREVFISAPDNVLIVVLRADKAKSINLNVRLTREKDAEVRTEKGQYLKMVGQVIDQPDELRGPGGAHMKFSALLKADSKGGKISAEKDHLKIENASEVKLVFTAATDYNLEKLSFDRSINPEEICSRILADAAEKSFSKLKKAHLNEYQPMFNRVDIDLGTNTNAQLPTDKRLAKVKAGESDLELIALYFQYGRYLLMGSSRKPGVLPANLQGIWNDSFQPPWGADYHTNINLQMNYWPAMVTNLPETMWPLIDFVDELREPGAVTARKMYNADGWTLHHLTDVFGRTALHDGVRNGMFAMGGPWMCFPMWRYYEYTNNEAYLRDVAWPILKGSAEFVLDYLYDDGQGHLISAPSYSPENAYYFGKDRKKIRFTYSPTMDIMIIRELFNYCLQTIDILDVDRDLEAKMKDALQKLHPIKVGANGTIQEWVEDFEEVDPGHRHISHLVSLHPGSQINHNDTPELLEAAEKTLDRRLANGGGHTGWSRAWIINFFARLRNSDKAYENLMGLLKKSTLTNLFDTHPPFQIDGNFGGTAGIAEMLLQSHEGEINILPALPKAWKTGYVKGLVARGGVVIDIEWENNQLKHVKLVASASGEYKIRYKEQLITVDLEQNKAAIFNGNLKRKK